MAVRVGINGFGRMGRLALRAGWDCPEIEFVHLNKTGGDGATSAHLLHFESIHGRWNRVVRGDTESVFVDGQAPGVATSPGPCSPDCSINWVPPTVPARALPGAFGFPLYSSFLPRC
jgi:hypothetical protein